MARSVKHRIKFRSDIVEDIEEVAVEVIEYQLDTQPIVSYQRDAWEPMEITEAIIHRLFPHDRDPWEVKRTYDDPEWEGEIIVYADEIRC